MNKYRSRTPLSKRRLGTETHGDRRFKRKRKRGEADAHETDLQQDDIVTYTVILQGTHFQLQSSSPLDACQMARQRAVDMQLIESGVSYDATVICPDGIRLNIDTQKLIIGND